MPSFQEVLNKQKDAPNRQRALEASSGQEAKQQPYNALKTLRRIRQTATDKRPSRQLLCKVYDILQTSFQRCGPDRADRKIESLDDIAIPSQVFDGSGLWVFLVCPCPASAAEVAAEQMLSCFGVRRRSLLVSCLHFKSRWLLHGLEQAPQILPNVLHLHRKRDLCRPHSGPRYEDGPFQ